MTPEQERLERLVDIVMHKTIGQLGWSDARAAEIRPRLTSKGSQDHLYAAIEHTIGSPGYFQTSRKLLDVGCGTGSFVHSALERGHESFGVDLDLDLLNLGWAKIPALGMPAQWIERTIACDASRMPFGADTFDLAVGHQFIEHVSEIPATISEMLRVVKKGGVVVLYAPEYRAPYETHYDIPWPPFATREVAENWLRAWDRPTGGIGSFNYVTASQVAAVFEVLPCDVLHASIDRPIDRSASGAFDVSSPAAVAETARRMRAQYDAGTLPENFRMATSFAVAVRKR
jgi:SAM-dependent methyltransferase